MAIVRLRRPRPADYGMRGMGDFRAIVVDVPEGLAPGELYRQGMRGIGEMGAAKPRPAGGGVINTITGGELARISARLESATRGLKLSIAASGLAAGAALLMLFSTPRRRIRR